MSSLLQDLLQEELTENNRRIIVNRVFESGIIKPLNSPKSRTMGSSKSLVEFYGLVNDAIKDYEKRAGTTEENQILFTEEEPDNNTQTETISFSLVRREPGAYAQGAPFEGKVKNLNFITREKGEDAENPGYQYAINGYLYDNVVRFTCWATTNKAANARAMWLEDMMEDYKWWFTAQGLQRVLFWGRNQDLVTVIDGNKWYGRPLEYFVRTEKLKVFQEKELEEIIINLAVKSE